MRSMIDCSTRISRPNAFASASRVRSSSVGPSPPVVMTMSAQSNAYSISPTRSSSWSPTTALRTSWRPKSSRATVSFSEFVSTRVGPSISEPMAMTAAVPMFALGANRRFLDLFLLFREHFPLRIEKVDHRLQVGVLHLNLLDPFTVAEDFLRAHQHIVALPVRLG